jgi:tripartite-type tricarboxylate transporter receptor subunit TctC
MKKLLNVLAGATLALSTLTASAQAWPTKPVKIIVPFPAGGLADILARQLGEELGKQWKQPVVVENRAGAGTMIAGEATAKSAPDGYTLLLANDATLSSNQYIYKKMPYDPVTGFTPIINIAASPIVMLAGGKFAAQTLQDVVNVATREPEKINYGTFGIGSTAHVDAHSFMALSKTRMTHVPYKGVAEVMVALAADQVQISFTGIPPALPFARDGRVRVLAVSSTKRSALLPNVPTFAEAGMPGFQAAPWFGLVGPAGVPRALVDKIAADVAQVITQPAFLNAHITGVGLELLNQGPDQYAAFLAADRANYAVKMKRLNIQLD